MFNNDKNMFKLLSMGGIDDIQSAPRNFIQFSSSDIFFLKKNESQRFSIALINSFDLLTDLKNRNYSQLNVVKLKKRAQDVIDDDYRNENITVNIYEERNTPVNFTLYQNYPNPFNPTTVISYQLSAFSQVELSIFNLLGQKIKTLVSEKQPSGTYKVEWDASGFTSGIYIYKLKAKGQEQKTVSTKRMVLIK